MQGRTRKPAMIRHMEGNPGKSRIPEEIDVQGTPLAPADMQGEAMELWQFIRDAMPLALLRMADSAIIERMANAWARYRWCERNIARSGILVQTGDKRKPYVRNPLLIVQRQASEEMHQCGEALGMSPVARTRISADLVPKEVDPLTLLLDGVGNSYAPAEAAE